MNTRTLVVLVAATCLAVGCGDSTNSPDNGVVTDIGTDTITGGDTIEEDGRIPDTVTSDVNNPEDLAGRDLASVDGVEPEPCRPGEACDDKDSCTINDLCDEDAVCAGVAVDICDDGIDCTFDKCTTETDCTHDTKPGWCYVDGKCIEDGDVDPAVLCRSCQTALKKDQLLPDDNLACDDGEACTANDHCHEGFCVASAMNCNDNNSCTVDSCNGGSCVHENVEGMCDDDNLCTENDLCVDGVCTGSQIGCWDQNSCTQDACHPDFGCVHEFLDIGCDDGNICSVGDSCWEGLCISGDDRLDCDDMNECTDDGCVPIRVDGCVHIPNVAACDDGDPCTLEDKCKGGACTSGAGVLDCDDGNICTDDSCETGVGCVHVNNVVPCDDNEPCSLDDVCGGGTCQPGVTPLECDDGNECTTDRCEPGVGCVFENNLNICDDDNVCTIGDVCGEGTCLGAPQVGMCDDDDSCTLDYCLPTGDAPGCYHKGLPECRPSIIIDYPPRAATMNRVAGDTITVLGHVEYPKPGMKVWIVNVNGLDVMLNPADSTFNTDITAGHGMNPIVAYGSDVQFGFQDYVVQSFYYSDNWFTVTQSNPTAAMIADGVMIFLGKTVWDDNDTSTPDDIATLLTNILGTLDLSSLISNPVTTGSFGWCDYKVNVTHIKYGKPSIDLVPDYGKMKVKVVIPKFSADIDVPISGFMCPDFSGSATATSITINADLNLSIDAAGNPVAAITNPDVVVEGLNIDIDGIWGFLFNWIVDFFEDN